MEKNVSVSSSQSDSDSETNSNKDSLQESSASSPKREKLNVGVTQLQYKSLSDASNEQLDDSTDMSDESISQSGKPNINSTYNKSIIAAILKSIFDQPYKTQVKNNKFVRNPNFIPRENIKEQLDLELRKNHFAVIVGMGGVGKSELVNDYICELKADRINNGNQQNNIFFFPSLSEGKDVFYNFIGWLDFKEYYDFEDENNLNKEQQYQELSLEKGISIDNIKNNLLKKYPYINLARYLGVRKDDGNEYDVKDIASCFDINLASLIKKIKEVLVNKKPWLLIFDDIDDKNLLQQDLTDVDSGGDIICTSRSTNWQRVISLNTFSETEGKSYIVNYFKKNLHYYDKTETNLSVVSMFKEENDFTEQAKNLCRALEGYPLLLQLSAQYITKTGITIKEFLEVQNLNLFFNQLCQSFLTNFNKFINFNNLNLASKSLLNCCAFLDFNGISASFLKQIFVKIGTGNNFEPAFINLLENSLLVKNELKENFLFSINPFIQKLVRYKVYNDIFGNVKVNNYGFKLTFNILKLLNDEFSTCLEKYRKDKSNVEPKDFLIFNHAKSIIDCLDEYKNFLNLKNDTNQKLIINSSDNDDYNLKIELVLLLQNMAYFSYYAKQSLHECLRFDRKAIQIIDDINLLYPNKIKSYKHQQLILDQRHNYLDSKFKVHYKLKLDNLYKNNDEKEIKIIKKIIDEFEEIKKDLTDFFSEITQKKFLNDLNLKKLINKLTKYKLRLGEFPAEKLILHKKYKADLSNITPDINNPIDNTEFIKLLLTSLLKDENVFPSSHEKVINLKNDISSMLDNNVDSTKLIVLLEQCIEILRMNDCAKGAAELNFYLLEDIINFNYKLKNSTKIEKNETEERKYEDNINISLKKLIGFFENNTNLTCDKQIIEKAKSYLNVLNKSIILSEKDTLDINDSENLKKQFDEVGNDFCKLLDNDQIYKITFLVIKYLSFNKNLDIIDVFNQKLHFFIQKEIKTLKASYSQKDSNLELESKLLRMQLELYIRSYKAVNNSIKSLSEDASQKEENIKKRIDKLINASIGEKILNYKVGNIFANAINSKKTKPIKNVKILIDKRDEILNKAIQLSHDYFKFLKLNREIIKKLSTGKIYYRLASLINQSLGSLAPGKDDKKVSKNDDTRRFYFTIALRMLQYAMDIFNYLELHPSHHDYIKFKVLYSEFFRKLNIMDSYIQSEINPSVDKLEALESELLKLNQQIVNNPKNYKARKNRAEILIMLNRYNEALIDYNLILSEEKSKLDIYIKRGHLLYILEKYNEALIDYRYVQFCKPGDSNIQLWITTIENKILSIQEEKLKNKNLRHHDKIGDFVHFLKEEFVIQVKHQLDISSGVDKRSNKEEKKWKILSALSKLAPNLTIAAPPTSPVAVSADISLKDALTSLSDNKLEESTAKKSYIAHQVAESADQMKPAIHNLAEKIALNFEPQIRLIDRASVQTLARIAAIRMVHHIGSGRANTNLPIEQQLKEGIVKGKTKYFSDEEKRKVINKTTSKGRAILTLDPEVSDPKLKQKWTAEGLLTGAGILAENGHFWIPSQFFKQNKHMKYKYRFGTVEEAENLGYKETNDTFEFYKLFNNK